MKRPVKKSRMITTRVPVQQTIQTSKGELTVRSSDEGRIAQSLDDLGVGYTYEEERLKFVKPEENRTYKPDFKLENGLYIEVKGKFTSADRKKMALVIAQHPDKDIRMVFVGNRKKPSDAKINKKSSTSYGDWCLRNNIKFADNNIPDGWLRTPPTD